MTKLSQLPPSTTPQSTDTIPSTSSPSSSPSDVNITLQTLQNTIANAGWLKPYVVSGLIWSQTTGLTGTMTSGQVVINGFLVNVSSVSTYTFTASQD